MCIAGHNYNNYQFFSRLRKLNIGDSIYIYDLSGNKIEYTVYKNYETDDSDLSCTAQNTNGKREVTLVTCNNIKNKRRIVKALEKEQ
jgi:LPXTG-site transpeptidase (sortase) family protein